MVNDLANGCEVNLNVDLLNCGACGHTCPVPANGAATCVSGVCGITCSTGYTNCGGNCVNEQTDPNNCGACGAACAAGQTCSGGTCSTTGCPPGYYFDSGEGGNT